MLTEQNRTKLDGIVQQMASQNAPQADVQAVVNDFKTKYDTPTSATTQPKQSFLGGVASTIGDVAKGIGQGATSTVVGLGQLALKGYSMIPGLPGKNLVNQSIQTGEDIKNTQLKPQNTAQTIGKIGEQVGEMFIPVGLEEKVATKLAEIPELAKNAPLMAKITQGLLKGGIKAGASGAEFAGKTYLQTGGDTKQAGQAGIIAAATSPIVGVAGKLLSKLPETAWGSILKRVPTAVAKNPELEQQIAKEGVVGLTRPQISATLGRNIQDLEVQIADVLSSKTGTISTQSVADRLASLKAQYSNIPGEETSVAKIDEISQGLLAKGKDISIQDANQLKRDIYGLISKSYGKGILEVPAKTEAQKMVARGLKEEIEKQIPEIKGLNNKQGIYIQAKKAIDKTIARQTGKGIAGTGIGLYDILATLGATVAGGASGGTEKGIIVGAGALAAKKIAESPATLSTASAITEKVLNYFDGLSPTQKMLFYNGLRGLTIETTKSNK